MKTILFLLFFPLLLSAQCPSNYVVIPSKVPITFINGAIVAKERIDKHKVICMEVYQPTVACSKFKHTGANGVIDITSHQQFKVRTLKSYTRNMFKLLPTDAVAINGVIIDNLNIRIVPASLKSLEEIWLPQPIKVGNEMVNRVYVIWTEKR